MKLTEDKLLEHLYYKKLPEVYRNMDRELKTYPFKRYLQALIGGGYGEALSDTNRFLELIDPMKCPTDALKAYLASFGLKYYANIAEIYQRRFLSNIGELLKRRGTYNCIAYLVRVLTGLEVRLEYIRGAYRDYEGGRHLVVTLLPESPEILNSIDTTMEIVNTYIKDWLPYYIYPATTAEITATHEATKYIAGGTYLTKKITIDQEVKFVLHDFVDTPRYFAGFINIEEEIHLNDFATGKTAFKVLAMGVCKKYTTYLGGIR